jgi:archaeosine synthase
MLERHRYAAVVSLVGDDLPGLSTRVASVTECAAKGKPNEVALSAAAQAISQALEGAPDVDPRRRTHEDLASIARMQFGGPAAAMLFDGTSLRGRWPWSKLNAGKVQLSLTLDGARRLAQAGAYRVEIEPFTVRGDIFAVGVVRADPEVRAGDEVAVVQGGEVVAAGTARMGAVEMAAARRGVAVAVRHKAR